MNLQSKKLSHIVDENQIGIYSLVVGSITILYILTNQEGFLYLMAYDFLVLMYMANFMQVNHYKEKQSVNLSNNEFTSHICFNLLVSALLSSYSGYSTFSIVLVLLMVIGKFIGLCEDFTKSI